MKYHVKFAGLVSSVLLLLGSCEGDSICRRMEEHQFRSLGVLSGLDYKDPDVLFECQGGAWIVSKTSPPTNGPIKFASHGECKDLEGQRGCVNYGGYVYNDGTGYSNIVKYFINHDTYEKQETYAAMGKLCSPDGVFCFDIGGEMCYWYYMNVSWVKYCHDLPIVNLNV